MPMPERYIFLCVAKRYFLAKKIQSAISKKVEELDLVDSIFGCKICCSIMSQSIVKKIRHLRGANRKRSLCLSKIGSALAQNSALPRFTKA